MNIPEAKNPQDYTPDERRAEILQILESTGHPKMVSQSQLAIRYGVSQQQISKDMVVLREKIKRQFGDDIHLTNYIVYNKALMELMTQGRYLDAVRVLESWNEWLFSMGARKKNNGRDSDFALEQETLERLRGSYEKACRKGS